MKYMVQWRIHDDKRHEALKVFSGIHSTDDEIGASDVNLIGRWHDVIGFTGVGIVETDNPEAMSKWLLSWNQICDIEAIPVFDDEETRKLGREFLGK